MEGKAITTEVLRAAIQIEGTADEGIEERKQVLPVNEIRWLNFSFKGIKNIDYLVGLERLVKLQLDNNNITKIENLEHLHTLTDLDLSFNKIEKIENLSGLTGLLDLSLYNNKITVLEGLEALEEIKSLSLGNNQIKDLDKVLYLRQFRFLRLLCLEGNPLCMDPEYKLFTIAWMRNLLYLDHHFCFASLVKQAREVYQDAMTEVQEKDKLDTIAWTQRRASRVQIKTFMLAHLDHVNEFFDYMFEKDPEHRKLLTIPGLVVAGIDAYRQKFRTAADDLIAKVVGLHEKRCEERRLYELAVQGVLARRDGEGRELLRSLHKKKKKVFQHCRSDRTTAEANMMELYTDIDVLKEKLFEIEVETYGEINKLWNEFEDSFYETLDHAKNFFADFFGQLRTAEGEWSETLLTASAAIAERYDAGDVEEEVDDVAFAEDMKVKAIEALRKKTYEEGIMFMIKRNREKISEIWFIIDKNRDEIDFMKQQVLHGDVSSVRA
ncbi:dynein regulatory complex subunit 3 isoform X3 [Physcomitrium patens]|uniref:dynein regulatory complex subunit 3 isoform X3 n=1 Tax=Physcomitrium patens TaxID=3218 RepID=UPI000D167464|nr:dynein regulatory complex subunit 3-like isoform X3 [Physcomitrium patens]|eukprot:XP_024361229.1 dynein regulatory complex subunit 3-like isoform X3 [Physcomitrella patens]